MVTMADLSSVSTTQLQIDLESISVSPQSSQSTFYNWAHTFECRPERVYNPSTIVQCRQILELARREGVTVHPVGVGHSPSDLACTNGWLMKMEGICGTVQVRFYFLSPFSFQIS